nr:hypothetical protein GCM10020063_050390 [Dactylosporangium thailandense]
MSDRLAYSDLDAIDLRCAAAFAVVPTPWTAHVETRSGIGGNSFVQGGDPDVDHELYLDVRAGTEQLRSPDARLDAVVGFVAAASEDLPRLLSEVRRLRSQAPAEPQLATLSDYQRGLRTRFLQAQVVPPPQPWTPAASHCTPVGGLQGVGFAVDPASHRDLLLVTSIDGHGLFDTVTGQKLARDRDPYPDLPCPDEDLSCPGLGPIAGVPVRIAGLHGGGLHTGTQDGWVVDTVSPDWPSERVVLSRDGNPNSGEEGSTWWLIFHSTYSELRAVGFSPSGNTLVVATSSDVTIWAREEPRVG